MSDALKENLAVDVAGSSIAMNGLFCGEILMEQHADEMWVDEGSRAE